MCVVPLWSTLFIYCYVFPFIQYDAVMVSLDSRVGMILHDLQDIDECLSQIRPIQTRADFDLTQLTCTNYMLLLINPATFKLMLGINQQQFANKKLAFYSWKIFNKNVGNLEIRSNMGKSNQLLIEHPANVVAVQLNMFGSTNRSSSDICMPRLTVDPLTMRQWDISRRKVFFDFSNTQT